MRHRFWVLPLVLSLSLTGCHMSSNATESLDATETTVPDGEYSVAFSYSTSTVNYPGNEEGIYLLHASSSFPTASMPQTADTAAVINRDLRQQQENFRVLTVSKLAEAKEMQNAHPDDTVACRLEQTYRPMRLDQQVISLRQDTLWSDAPEHETVSYRGLNYDASTGKRLSLRSIADDPDALEESAACYITEQLRSPVYQNCSQWGDELTDAAVTELLSDNDLWFFTDYGITFALNAPSVCPEETHTVTVPYQQLEGLKPEYQYVGPYHLQGLVGSAVSGDLDNNEEVEALYYNTVWNEEENALSSTLIVDGDDCSSLLSELEPALSSGAVAAPNQYYYLIDLDISDDYIELAIADRGTPQQPGCTHFFRYVDFNLVYMGKIDDFVDSDTFRATGDGYITCNRRLSLLPEFTTAASYEISGDELELVEEDWYPLSAPEDENDEPAAYSLAEELTLYTSDSRFSDSITLYPGNTQLRILSCDEDHWLQVETSEGERYYLHLEDVDRIDDETMLFDVLK